MSTQSGTGVSRSGGKTTKALGVMNDDAWVAKDLPRTGHDDRGGASRFFPTFRQDRICDLFERIPSCERVVGAATKSRPIDRARDSAVSAAPASASPGYETSNPPSRSNARTVASPSPTSHPTVEGSAPRTAPTKPEGWSALHAASAGNLCDACVTAIARSVAATRRGHSALLELGLRSTRDSSEQILTRSLALIAEDLENSGTTSTTTALTTSLGCVVAAIRTFTTRESLSAARKFAPPSLKYEAKAPASERPKLADGTAHATVKPLDLMRWLVRLVTPPGGVVLDPFAGSGTTGEAAIVEGFQSVLIELDPQHAELIKQRLTKDIQPTLFGSEVTA